MTTGKTIALTRWTFVGKVIYLLFNILSRLVITFLPRSKHLLISWLQSPSAVILEHQKLMLLNCGIGEDSWECSGLQGDQTGLLLHHSSKAPILWHSAFFTVQLSHSVGVYSRGGSFDRERALKTKTGPWARGRGKGIGVRARKGISPAMAQAPKQSLFL